MKNKFINTLTQFDLLYDESLISDTINNIKKEALIRASKGFKNATYSCNCNDLELSTIREMLKYEGFNVDVLLTEGAYSKRITVMWDVCH